MKLFRIVRVIGIDIATRIDEFVVAKHIRDVVDYLKLDFQDEATTIESITEECPVTKVL